MELDTTNDTPFSIITSCGIGLFSNSDRFINTNEVDIIYTEPNKEEKIRMELYIVIFYFYMCK